MSLPEKTIPQLIAEHEASIARLKKMQEVRDAIGPDVYDYGDVIRLRYNYRFGDKEPRPVVVALTRNADGMWQESASSVKTYLSWDDVVKKIVRLAADKPIEDLTIEVSKEWRPMPGLPPSS